MYNVGHVGVSVFELGRGLFGEGVERPRSGLCVHSREAKHRQPFSDLSHGGECAVSCNGRGKLSVPRGFGGGNSVSPPCLEPPHPTGKQITPHDCIRPVPMEVPHFHILLRGCGPETTNCLTCSGN